MKDTIEKNIYKTSDLYNSPNSLANEYKAFNLNSRILLTGHSHQAWPDCSFEGQKQAWKDAASWADEKWERAFNMAEKVRAAYSALIDDPDGAGHIALAPNTHDLLIRFLSALPLDKKPRLVTTDGEFHTIRRQLDRLEEAGVEVIRVDSSQAETVAERLCAVVDDRTSAMLVSSVFFKTGQIVEHLGEVMKTCSERGIKLLIDAYHSINVVPFSIKSMGLEDAYIIGGGYKYCQLGEGNCFMRFPSHCKLRPIITGWFSEFDLLEKDQYETGVPYGKGALRFSGSTYDPTSHYRAMHVFKFFKDRNLSPAFLRKVSQHQIKLLAEKFDALDADPKIIKRENQIPIKNIAGFLVLRSSKAKKISSLLREQSVYTDYRGESLRFGPAPYLSDNQLENAIGILGTLIH